MSKVISEIVDELVAIVSMERGQAVPMISDASRPKLSNMRNLDVTHLLLGDEWFVLTEGTPEVLWPIKCAYAMQTYEDNTWHFTRVRSVLPREVRGKARIVAPKMLLFDIVSMYRDGRTISATEIFSHVNKTWVDADAKMVTRHHDTVRNMIAEKPGYFKMKCEMAIGMALRQRYEWSVSIGEPGGPSFRFATDASGIKSILSEREKGTTGRRSALRGWVVDHWRQSRSDAEAEVYVRQHLRGREAFTWRGYNCEWEPSQYDLERNDAFKHERAMMGMQAVRPKF